MTRSLYIVGAPGTGKSTVMVELVRQLGWSWLPDQRVWRELWTHDLVDADCAVQATYLGKQRASFSGTDALSMSASPRVVEWLHETELPAWILGEGARLGTPKFLPQLHRVAPLLLAHLVCPPEEAIRRVTDRAGGGRTITPGYQTARRTGSANAAEAMAMLDVPVLQLDSSLATPQELAAKILVEME